MDHWVDGTVEQRARMRRVAVQSFDVLVAVRVGVGHCGEENVVFPQRALVEHVGERDVVGGEMRRIVDDGGCGGEVVQGRGEGGDDAGHGGRVVDGRGGGGHGDAVCVA